MDPRFIAVIICVPGWPGRFNIVAETYNGVPLDSIGTPIIM